MKLDTIYRSFSIVWVAAIVAVLAACTDDALIENYGEESDELVEMKLNFKTATPELKVSSRAPSENLVNDLYVFIFNANTGTLRASKYYTVNELNDENNNPTDENNWVNITTTVGPSKIYGIANVGGSVSDYEDGLKTKLDKITTLEELQNLSLEVKAKVERNGTYLMAGEAVNNNNDYYTIVKGEDIKIINLRRLDSEITFKFTNAANTTFVLESYQVFNVPKKTYVLDHEATYSIGTNGDTWDAAQSDDDFFKTDVIGGYLNTEKQFTFYMAENRKNRKKDATGNGDKELYACREKQEKTSTGATQRPTIENGAYEYAPDYGTYVLVKGKFYGKSTHYANGTDEQKTNYTGEVEASVRYIIHLGYVNKDANDFFSNRNTKYTYNVNVQGVDDIVVEVVEENEKENAPGAEGDVLFTQGTAKYILDAHYETVLLTFNKDAMAKKPDAYFAYRIKTPYAEFTKTVGGAEPTVKDVDWIRITRNEKTNNVYNKTLGNYPKTPEGNEERTYLTIDELIEELKRIASGENSDLLDSEGDVVYTCHINEFYYDKAPEGYTAPATRPLWTTFVNQPNRELHILSDVELSPDGQSSITRSTYVITQRSIQTFYRTDLNESFSAYGVETVNETGALDNYQYYKSQIGKYDNALQEKDNGLNNFKTILSGVMTLGTSQWITYVDEAKNGFTDSNLNWSELTNPIVAMKAGNNNNNYQRAYLACLQRNRDTDGNGTIDDNEIKWYLPAQNQYVGMFLGDAGISEEAKLYTDPNYKHIHYVTSTIFDANNNGRWDQNNEDEERKGDGLVVYWAEETVSTSHYGQDTSWGQNYDGTKHRYRCMRNLYNTTNDAPKNYYDINAESNNGGQGVIVTVPYLNTGSLRAKQENGELGPHDHWNDGSRIATTGFRTGPRTGANTNLETIVSVRAGNTTCYNQTPQGTWRAPNVRELYLMMIAGNNILTGNEASRTRFHFARDENAGEGDESGYCIDAPGSNAGNEHLRYGWYREQGEAKITMNQTDANRDFRCVRDN